MTLYPTSTTKRHRIRYAAGAVAAMTALAGSAIILAPAAGAGPSHVLTHGRCSKGGVVSMELQHSDPGRIEAGFEVDHAKVGSIWRVRLTHNGVTYYTGLRTAKAPDGTFSVDRVLRDLPRVDAVTGYARNVRTGNLCTVTARI